VSHTAVTLAPLRVTVVNANLKFVRYPMLVGHYRSIALTGSEYAMDVLLGGAMSTSLRINLYPDQPGSNQQFVNTQMNRDNPMQPPRPDAVIVVGLGEEGKLRASDLTMTVRQGVMAWSQRLAGSGNGGRPQPFELASTLIGSSGTGNPAGQAARLVAQGVREANLRLVDAGWPTVKHLHLVELFLDRATEAWRSLQVLATASPGDFVITPFVQSGLGSLQRPLDPSYRGSEYDLIAAMTQRDTYGESMIAYTVDTRRARTEVRAQATQLKLLRELTATAADDAADDRQIGRSLFRLLVPLEMQPFLGGSDAMLLELDGGTAGIPWELLDTTPEGDSARREAPWAIRTKLLRKLRTADFRITPHDANADSHVLIIGEPRCDDATLPRLPAARAEARDIAALFKSRIAAHDGRVRDLISGDGPRDVGPDARTVINALLERDWRIIHIAGHGEPPDTLQAESENVLQSRVDPRGVVLSHGTYLGPREIATMATVPELVFVNCCFTAVGDPSAALDKPERTYGERARFAAGVAESLISIGVRCVIASGWAVEDEPAMAFAKTFYEQLLQGARFIDAVAAGREAAWHMGGNTWAAYQCYGDPDWRFRSPTVDAAQTMRTDERKYAGIASWRTLLVALEAIAVESRYPDYDMERGQASLTFLETSFGDEWGDIGSVAEGFGNAWSLLEDPKKAVAWHRRAMSANDGSASINCVQDLGNLRVRIALESVEYAQRMSNASGDASVLAEALVAARAEIASAIDMVTQITRMQPTIDRESLCGSSWKRLSMLELIAGDREAEARAITRMKEHYQAAEALARASSHPELYYPALNRMAAELIVDAESPDWSGFDATFVADVRDSLFRKVSDDPDFWSVVGATELRVYEAMAKRKLAPVLSTILSDYDALHARVSAKIMWSSVYDQARWVLPKYVSRVDDDEDNAAMALVAHLGELTKDR